MAVADKDLPFVKVLISMYFLGMIILFFHSFTAAFSFLLGGACVKLLELIFKKYSARTKPKSKRLLKRRNT